MVSRDSRRKGLLPARVLAKGGLPSGVETLGQRPLCRCPKSCSDNLQTVRARGMGERWDS